MLWIKLAWRNLWRNRRRTSIQLIVISGSLFFAIWINNIAVGSYEKMIYDSVKMGSGHLSFHNNSYLQERTSGLYFNFNEAKKIIKGEKTIAKAFPRCILSGLARSSRENKAVIIMGVDFNLEKDINPILEKKKLVKGGLPKPNSKRGAYVGNKLASNLRLKIGQKLVIMFQNINGEITSKLLRIHGIFQTGIKQLDSSTLFVERKSLAKSFGNKEAIHELALLLSERKYLKKTINRLKTKISRRSNFNIFPWQKTMKQLADAINMDHAQLKIMVIMLYVLVGIGTVNLMLMSVLERSREFGLLQALGLDKAQIKKIVACEALILGVLGISLGLMTSTIASGYTWHYGLDFSGLFGSQEVAGMLFEPKIHSGWDIPWMAGLSIVMIIVVYIASIYPSNKAMKDNPAEAMRKY